MWSYIHNIGAATSTGLGIGLPYEKLVNAMALSLYQPNFCLMPGFYQEGCKLLTACYPVRIGIQAALYANQGLEGPKNIIEGHMGLFHFFAFHPIPEFTTSLKKT
ncbi:MAG: hypothetical protein ACTSRZ_18920 [Promethearchaeota archaeon]